MWSRPDTPVPFYLHRRVNPLYRVKTFVIKRAPMIVSLFFFPARTARKEIRRSDEEEYVSSKKRWFSRKKQTSC